MTDATTRKPVPDPVAFGRDLARYAKAEIENVGLAIAEVGVKEQELASIKRRLVRSINLAASARIMEDRRPRQGDVPHLRGRVR